MMTCERCCRQSWSVQNVALMHFTHATLCPACRTDYDQWVIDTLIWAETRKVIAEREALKTVRIPSASFNEDNPMFVYLCKQIEEVQREHESLCQAAVPIIRMWIRSYPMNDDTPTVQSE